MSFVARNRVSLRDLAVFARQLHTLVQASVPLVEALESLARSWPGRLGEAVSDCCVRIQSGQRLSQAFDKRRDVFTPVMAAMLRVGEQTGSLLGQMDRYAVLLERRHQLRSKVNSAALYPLFLCLASAAMVAAFGFLLLPAVEPFLRGLPVPLPLSTRSLLAACHLAHSPTAWLALAAVLFVLLWDLPRRLAAWREDSEFAVRSDRWMWYLARPYRSLQIAHSMATLATAIEVGMTMLDALEITAETCSNQYLARQFQALAVALKCGETFPEAVQRMPALRGWMVAMLVVGEETGQLTRCFQHVAALCEQDALAQIETACSLIEPLLLSAIGLLAGYLAVATLSPIAIILTSL